jgi:hypothetical protein
MTGVQLPTGAIMGSILFATASRPALGSIQHPIQWVSKPLAPWVKRPVHEADHPSPFSDEVKNEWSYTSTPPIRLHGVVLSYALHTHTHTQLTRDMFHVSPANIT